MYQRDVHGDAFIQSRINDQQENQLATQDLQQDLQDASQRNRYEEKLSELEEQLLGAQEQSEVQSAEGLVIDRVLTENLLIDPSICEFWDYTDADWMCQVIPMKRSQAEA